MSDLRVNTTLENLRYKLNINDNSDDLEVRTNIGQTYGTLYANSKLGDSDVTMQVANDGSSSDEIKYRLVDMAEFKFDSFTPIYDKSLMEVERTVDDDIITVKLNMLSNLNASIDNPVYLMSFIYPNTVFFKAASLDSDFSVSKTDGESSLVVVVLKSLIAEQQYSFDIKIRNALLTRDGKIDNSQINYKDLFDRITLEVDGGTPFDD